MIIMQSEGPPPKPETYKVGQPIFLADYDLSKQSRLCPVCGHLMFDPKFNTKQCLWCDEQEAKARNG